MQKMKLREPVELVSFGPGSSCFWIEDFDKLVDKYAETLDNKYWDYGNQTERMRFEEDIDRFVDWLRDGGHLDADS